MRIVGLALAAFALLIGPGKAQVINGESTYEDNFLHNPPEAAKPDRNAASQTPKDAPDRSATAPPPGRN